MLVQTPSRPDGQASARGPRIAYSALIDRPPLRWPGGARVALWVQMNLEHFEPDGPGTILPPSPARPPQVDAKNAGWREYGARVGIWRLMEILDHHGVRASAPINAEVLTVYPEIVREALRRNWELMGHGLNNSRTLSDLSEDDERTVIKTCVRALSAAAGRPVRGWLGPGLAETPRTLDLLAEAGIEYVSDWCNDDQPYPIEVPAGRLIGVPYSMEINDYPAFLGAGLAPEHFYQSLCDQFDVLFDEGAQHGRILGLCLHPFIAGQAFRARWIARGLEYVLARGEVWVTTAEEICDWYYEHAYATALDQVRQRAHTLGQGGFR
jgi:peptidoglycan/xylan/chitin deacetylase (PgdA/CDA1 family)